MLLKIVKTSLFLLIPLLVSSQYEEKVEVEKNILEAMEESTFLKAQDYRRYLSLSLDESFKMEKVMREYNMEVRELIKSKGDRAKTFQREYKALIDKRNAKLGFLDAQQASLFQIMEESNLDRVKNYYIDMIASLKENSDFMDELAIYHMSHQNTVLSERKAILEESISKEDSIAFIELRRRFNIVLDTAIVKSSNPENNFKGLSYKKIVKATSKDLPENKLIWQEINKYYNKYKKPINTQYDEIVSHHKEWSSGIKKLLRTHVPYEKTVDMNQLFYVLTQFGVDRKINKFAFLLYDSSNIETFYEFNSKFEQLFIQTSL